MDGGVLSQEEINALLNEAGAAKDAGAGAGGSSEVLTESEKDAIGEVANISMGTAATTLSSLVNRKVEISTPVVTEAVWSDVTESFERPCVFIRIRYTVGLNGNNILVLRDNDVKVITDLMMGGDGTNTDGELGELHLSAISEAMNQMMGSSATSLSSMLNEKIDISPPVADLINLSEKVDAGSIDEFLKGKFVKIAFHMVVGDLVDSEMQQLYPFSFARDMCTSFQKNMEENTPKGGDGSAQAEQGNGGMDPQQAAQMGMGMPQMGMPQMGMPQMGMPMQNISQMYAGQPVNVQPAQFQAFMGDYNPIMQKENIDLIMDVPLEVTVELGRTSKSIQEILDFKPGTIIELNKIAGEPIDVLVNGKYVAKGEVVVIEESFGVRITEIVKN